MSKTDVMAWCGIGKTAINQEEAVAAMLKPRGMRRPVPCLRLVEVDDGRAAGAAGLLLAAQEDGKNRLLRSVLSRMMLTTRFSKCMISAWLLKPLQSTWTPMTC